jgi:hypothetical protein
MGREWRPAPGAKRNFDRVDTNDDGLTDRAEHEAFPRRRQPPEGDRGAAAPEDDSYRVVSDIDYAGDSNPRRVLDLFLPKGDSSGNRPLVVFIHGGMAQREQGPRPRAAAAIPRCGRVCRGRHQLPADRRGLMGGTDSRLQGGDPLVKGEPWRVPSGSGPDRGMGNFRGW